MRDAGLRDRGRRRRGKGRTSGGGGVQASALFRAGHQNTIVPQKNSGSGTPASTRATTATIEDFEGLVKPCISGEARFKGARRVFNAVPTDSSDSDFLITLLNASVSGSAITLSAAGGYALRNFNFVTPISNTTDVVISVTLQKGTKDGTVKIGNQTTADTSTITPTSTPIRYSHLATGGMGGGFWGLLNGDSNTGTVIATDWQIEAVDGQSNQNPSEYVSVGVESAPFHGANVDAVAYPGLLGLGLGQPCKNGNTVSSNVVTEAVGAVIGGSDSHADASGPFGRRVEGARINIALQSSVTENVAWTKSNVTATDNDAVSPAGTTTAALLLATAANGTVIQDLGVISSAEHRGGIWIKRKTGTGNIDLTIDNGSTWTTAAVTTTWTRFFSAAVTAANPDIGIRLVTDTDAVWVWNAQAEAAPFLSSDIETTSSAVTRNADVLTYVSVSNILDATGAMVCEAASDWATADAQSTLFDTGSMTVYTGAGLASTTMKAEDGTNTIALTGGATTENSPQKITVTWGAALDVYSEAVNATGSFDGSMNSATNFGIGCTDAGGTQFFGTIRNVKIFKKELSSSQVSRL